jgi:hypothetical protein
MSTASRASSEAVLPPPLSPEEEAGAASIEKEPYAAAPGTDVGNSSSFVDQNLFAPLGGGRARDAHCCRPGGGRGAILD